MSKYFWGVGLLLHPLFFKVSVLAHSSRVAKDTFFFTLTGLAVMLFGVKRKLPAQTTAIMVFFMAYSFFFQWDFLGAGALYQGFMFPVAFLFIATMFSEIDSKMIDTIYNFLAISGVINIIWATFDVYGYHPIRFILETFTDARMTFKSRFLVNKAGGPMLNEMLTSGYIAFCLPTIFRKWWIGLAPVYIYGLYITESTIGWAAALAAMLYFLWVSFVGFRRFPYFAAGLAMVASLFILTGDGKGFFSTTGRFAAWQVLIDSTTWKTFFFGNGLGWFHDVFPMIGKKAGLVFNYKQEHNEFLSAYVAFGAAGLATFILLFIDAAKSARCAIAASGLFAVFVSCWGHFPFHVSPLAAVALFYFVTCMSGLRPSRRFEYV